MRRSPYLVLTCLLLSVSTAYSQTGNREKIQSDFRLISIDNVCAWPNLTLLRDGSIVATIFNQPSHGRTEGDVECWATTDGGKFWEKRGTVTAHDPNTNRMNVAAGAASNGDMIIIGSGWRLKPVVPGQLREFDTVIRPWISRSSDGGRTWNVEKKAFPRPEKGTTEYIPFGDILPGNDGSLRVLVYAGTEGKVQHKVFMFQSRDDGKSWQLLSLISDGSSSPAAADKGHNETALFHLGEGKWLAAARRNREGKTPGRALDLFTSDDDGRTWKYDQALTENNQHPAHIQKLSDGRLLLTYGNRVKGEYGVAVKFSSDNGKTWGAEKLLIDDLIKADCGYPSSVQLPDGSILTVYYSSGAPAHQRYHMATVVWKP